MGSFRPPPRETALGVEEMVSSVAALATDAANTILLTGDETGRICIYDISNVCLGKLMPKVDVEKQAHVAAQKIDLKLQYSWPAHTKAVTSLLYLEDRKLVISASADNCVSIWTIVGQFLGTLSRSSNWDLKRNIQVFILYFCCSL